MAVETKKKWVPSIPGGPIKRFQRHDMPHQWIDHQHFTQPRQHIDDTFKRENDRRPSRDTNVMKPFWVKGSPYA